MAKHTEEPKAEAHERPHARSGGRKYSVTFAGLPPCAVEASSAEEAAKAAADRMGVILERCEKAPDVVEVT